MVIQTSKAHEAFAKIKENAPSYHPKIGIILGSGLGSFAEELHDAIPFDYCDLPGFPRVTVKGHGGKLVLGHLGTVGVACLMGRGHAYEGESPETIKTYIRTLKLLGCEYLIATNAAGSLHENMVRGS